jgi:hypothetical protein
MDFMTLLTPIGAVALFILMVFGMLRSMRWLNRYFTATPGRSPAAAIEADYARAGISLEDRTLTQTAKGTLQSVSFVVTLYPLGKPPHGIYEVAGAQGRDFELAREGNDMRQFLQLGSGHALQVSDAGIDLEQLDSALATSAERQAARALFHLGFDRLERRGGTLRAVKVFCAQLPELDVLRRALADLGVLRSGGGA